jgi:uracil-DNA glycosylase
MNKDTSYRALVDRRKHCRACAELVNPAVVAAGNYDSAEIGPWTRWQGWLDSPIFVVGQDFGDRAYFEKWRGEDKPDNATNRNLIELLASVGIGVEPPDGSASRGAAYFTNAVLCLKTGGLQAAVQSEWFAKCGSRFLRAQIELVGPRVVVSLGERAHNAVLAAFGLPTERIRDAIHSPGTPLPSGAVAVAVYHCGARGMNINRGRDLQFADWARVAAVLRAGAA